MENTKRGRKTNNSQSAGMMKGTLAASTSGTMDTPRGREMSLEMSTQNMFTPGTPDFPEPSDIPEALSFQTAQERDKEATVPGATETKFPDIEDLIKLGAPFGLEDLPDHGSYKVIIEFPSCMPLSLFGESVTDTGLDRSEKIFALAG